MKGETYLCQPLKYEMFILLNKKTEGNLLSVMYNNSSSLNLGQRFNENELGNENRFLEVGIIARVLRTWCVKNQPILSDCPFLTIITRTPTFSRKKRWDKRYRHGISSIFYTKFLLATFQC